MLRIYAERFVDASNYLGSIRELATQVAREHKEEDFQVLVREAERGRLKGTIVDLRAECVALDLKLTIAHIDRFLAFPELRSAIIAPFFTEIYQRFRDELAQRLMYGLNADRAEFYDKPLNGWGDVLKRFECSFDVEEARKCFALE